MICGFIMLFGGFELLWPPTHLSRSPFGFGLTGPQSAPVMLLHPEIPIVGLFEFLANCFFMFGLRWTARCPLGTWVQDRRDTRPNP